MNGYEQLREAARLIEEMTCSRFKHSIGSPFVCPGRDEYLAINMHRTDDYAAKVYRIHFDASLQTMGRPMDASDLRRLQQEIGTKWALLSALEMNDYALTPEEMQEFNDFIHQREEQQQEESSGPVLGLR
jgi:hypothetical protein